MEESSGNCLIERSKLQYLAEIKRSILEDKSRSDLLLPFLPVDSLFDGIIQSDDMLMLELLKNVSLFVKNIAEKFLRVCIISGGKLDSKVPSVIGSQFNSEWRDSYLPKVPSPRV